MPPKVTAEKQGEQNRVAIIGAGTSTAPLRFLDNAPLVCTFSTENNQQQLGQSYHAAHHALQDAYVPSQIAWICHSHGDINERIASLLMHSMFQRPGIIENDYQKAQRLYNAGQVEEALASISKFKQEVLDDNPHSYTSEKGFCLASKAITTYTLMANCYRDLKRYPEALSMIDKIQNELHKLLSEDALKHLSQQHQDWKQEAEEFAAVSGPSAAAKSV